MRPILRGAAALLAAPTLALSALVATSAPASAAIDPAPGAAAGSWLGAQLQGSDWIVHNQEYDFDDYGLTIDAALALDVAGDPDEVVGSISDALAAEVDSYVSPGWGTNLSAGAVAKALVLADTTGDDPTSYGGRNLVTDLEGQVATEGAIAGRIQDDWDSGDPYAADYANVLGQAFAVEGLDALDSASTDAVTAFLLDQQCSDGSFRLTFADVEAADQTCDGGNGLPSVDATAQAVDSLQSQLDDAEVAQHVEDAVDWLLDEQNADGSFGSDADIPAGNANSTGLAAYALMISDQAEAATHAAAWLRAHQVTNLADCVTYDAGDVGAVTYDDTALAAAQDGAMEPSLVDQSVRASAQGLLGLVAAQAGDPRAMFTAEYVKAGGNKPVGVGAAAPGEALCAVAGGQSAFGYADVDGDATLRVKVPSKTGTTVVDVANADGIFDTIEINALGKTDLKVKVKKQKVKKGKKQKVTVKGLAPAESVTVKLGKKSKSGQATRKGVYTAKLKVTGKPGKTTVKVKGQFGNRTGKQTFRVTK
ncbi:MAG: prenyltransferase/squalene oxidase repeat-containing protein [Nocardioides sp.]